jgi:hypothetical protein
MSNILAFLGLVAVWFVLAMFVLPRFGIPSRASFKTGCS